MTAVILLADGRRFEIEIDREWARWASLDIAPPLTAEEQAQGNDMLARGLPLMDLTRRHVRVYASGFEDGKPAFRER